LPRSIWCGKKVVGVNAFLCAASITLVNQLQRRVQSAKRVRQPPSAYARSTNSSGWWVRDDADAAHMQLQVDPPLISIPTVSPASSFPTLQRLVFELALAAPKRAFILLPAQAAYGS
jgi:hypothetical protein